MAYHLKKVKEHKYFVVPELKPKEDCVIIESKATFNQKAFVEDIKEQLLHLELCKEELAKLTYINIHRIKAILNCRGKKVSDAEVKEIKKKLSIS